MKKAMKIMAMVLFVVGMTALTSCTKSKEKLILGKWEITTITLSYGGETMTLTPQQLSAMIGGAEEIETIILEFKNDGKVYYEGEGVAYAIDGDKLTLAEGDEAIQLNILELTKNSLVLEAEAEGKGTLITLTFKKI